MAIVIAALALPALSATASTPTARQSVSAGWFHSCAIKGDGTVWCWGSNWAGQVGDGSTTSSNVPVQVGTSTDWVSVASGDTHTCAMNTSGGIWCWGYNHYGQLGIGSYDGGGDGSWTGDSRTTPSEVVGSLTWILLSGGDNHYCAITSGAELYCWGANGNPPGRLGTGDSDYSHPAPSKVGTEADWATVDAGDYHTCATKLDGSLYCWGYTLGDGRLGTGRSESSLTPLRVGRANNWISVSAGYYSSCAIADGGALFCWGANQSGQLGDGTTTMRLSPVEVSADVQWKSVDVDNNYGSRHTCGITMGGALYCWGANENGQLGIGSRENSAIPVQVGSDTDWELVSTGANHTCATKVNRSIYCWGSNGSGELGDGTTTEQLMPTLILPASDPGPSETENVNPTIELDAESAVVNYAEPQTIIASAFDVQGNPAPNQTLSLQPSIVGAAASCPGATATTKTDAAGRAVFKICPIKTAQWSAGGSGFTESPAVAISVRLVPSAPRSLYGKAAKGIIALSWVVPAAVNAGAVTDYIVQVRRAGTATWSTVKDGVSRRLVATVKKLALGQVYEFRIAAKNRAGVSDWSEPWQVALN